MTNLREIKENSHKNDYGNDETKRDREMQWKLLKSLLNKQNVDTIKTIFAPYNQRNSLYACTTFTKAINMISNAIEKDSGI